MCAPVYVCQCVCECVCAHNCVGVRMRMVAQKSNQFFLVLGLIGLLSYAALALDLLQWPELRLLSTSFVIFAAGCTLLVRRILKLVYASVCVCACLRLRLCMFCACVRHGSVHDFVFSIITPHLCPHLQVSYGAPASYYCVIMGCGVMWSVAAPMSATITVSAFSKLVGNQPQGLHMGVITAAGSVGRIVFPLLASVHPANIAIIAGAVTSLLCALAIIGFKSLASTLKEQTVSGGIDMNQCKAGDAMVVITGDQDCARHHDVHLGYLPTIAEGTVGGSSVAMDFEALRTVSTDRELYGESDGFVEVAIGSDDPIPSPRP